MPKMTNHVVKEALFSNAAVHRRTRVFFFLFSLLTLIALGLIPNAKAQIVDHQVVEHDVIENVPLNQAELDQILAPIALYPDSLLSQILVASTYPLEVVQAARWRQDNSHLSEDEVLNAVEYKDWDPSVKALAPFEDLLLRISDDLEWLQSVGDAFLQNEDQVLASVQHLRQKAYDNGSIADNQYYDVVEEDNNIVIESTTREIVYVPYYDTRVVYGNWWWDRYRPVYWDRPRNYVHLSGGFYWNSRFFIRPRLFFGGFHWGTRRLVVNHYYYDDPYRYRNNRNNTYYNIQISNYRHWSHNPAHRRGVRYPDRVVKAYSGPATRNANRNVTVNRNATVNRSGNAVVRKTNTPKVNTTNRSTSYQPNLRERTVNKVQEKLNNARQQTNRNTNSTARNTNNVTRNTNTTTNRNQTVRTSNPQINSRIVRPTTNRTVVNRNVTVNKSATPQRSISVNSTQRNSTSIKQRTITPRTTSVSKSANRTTSSSNKTSSRSSSNNTSSSSTSSSSSKSSSNSSSVRERMFNR